MRRIAVIVMMLVMAVSVFAAFNEKDSVNLKLDLENLPDGSKVIDVGFSSTPVTAFATDTNNNGGVTDITDVSLVPNPDDGSFSFVSSAGNALYAYARLQTADSVNITFSSAALEGYGDSSSQTSKDGAELGWILGKSAYEDGNTATAPESFSVTFDGAEKQSNVLFSHRTGSSGNTMDIYCMALDITSDESVDYRTVAMDEGINIWKTALKIGVSTTD